MSAVAESICRSLEQAGTYVEGTADERTYCIRVAEPINVEVIRSKLKMTQEGPAGSFRALGIDAGSLEQGSRQPEGPTRAYLLVIDRAPKAVQDALQGS